MGKKYDFISKGVIELTEHTEVPPVDEDEKTKIKEWSEREPILRQGMHDAEGEDDIHILQELLNRFLDDDLSNPLGVDGKFGKLSGQAVYTYQEFRMLEPGAVGPLTRGDMYKAYCELWTDNDPYMLDGRVKVYGTTLSPMGDIPFSYGQVSFYGGPTDCNDVMYGQAYLLESDNPSPKVFCEKNMELVKLKILREECLEMDSYPKVQCGSREVQAKGSYCLDEDNGLYCAIYTRSAFGLYGANNPKIVIKNHANGKIAILLRVDKGPRPDCGAIDISEGIMRKLGLKHDGMVSVGYADHDAELGIYE